jgi:hypothetical protein
MVRLQIFGSHSEGVSFMVRRITLVVLVCVAGGLAAWAQDPKDKPADPKTDAPKSKTIKAPEGWKFVKPKDKYFSFLVPRDVASEELNDGSFKAGGFVGKKTTYSATLKDGRDFVVVMTMLGGPATKDMKVNDVYDLLYEGDKGEKGTRISEPKEITVGVRKGREYFVTEKGTVRRVVSVVVPGRAFQFNAVADKREKVTDKDSDTFLTSLILQAMPKPGTPDKKDEKKDAAKPQPPTD